MCESSLKVVVNLGLGLGDSALMLVATRNGTGSGSGTTGGHTSSLALGAITSSRTLGGADKVGERSAERVAVVAVEGLALAVDRQHVDAGLGGQTIQADTAVLNRHHIGLARLSLEAVLVVVVEEAVEAGTVDKNIGRVGDTQTPGAGAVVGGARSERRVVVDGVLGEGHRSIGVALHVGGLGLDLGHVDGAGVAELVVVHLRVLGGSAVHPDGSIGLDQDTATVVDVNLLGVGAKLEVVIGNPEPGVLKVEVGGGLGDVHQHESALAVGIGAVGGVGVLGALAELQIGALGPTDASVDVPHASGTVGATLEIPFDHDSTRSGTGSLEDHVGDLDGTGVASLTNLEDGDGVGLVAELVALGHDHGPGLTNDLDGAVTGNLDGVSDDVGTVVEVDDLAVGSRVNNGLDGSSVISAGITLGTTRLDRDEAGDSVGLVLGLAASKDRTVGVQEGGGLGGVGASRAALNGVLGAAGVAVTLQEVVDLLITGKDGGAVTSVLDSNADVGRHVNVVDDQSAVGGGLGGGVRSVDTNRGVADGGVEDQDGTNSLRGDAVGHIDTNLAAVNGDILESPGPVPVHVDGGLAVLEGQVAGGELLVTEEGTVATAVEGQITHEATRTVVHEDTLLSVGSATVGAHVEDNVLQRGSLSDLPVDASTSGVVHGSEVDLEVANLTKEVVLVDPPVGAIIFVRVGVNDSHAREGSRSLNYGQAGGVTNELGVVVLLNRSADNVGTGGEIDKGRSDGRRLAVQAAATTIGDGGVDGGSVVSGAITSSAIILDVTENGVGAVGLEGSTRKMHGGVGEPVAAGGSGGIGSLGGWSWSWSRNGGQCQRQARDELREDHRESSAASRRCPASLSCAE